MYNESMRSTKLSPALVLIYSILTLIQLSPAPLRAWELAGDSIQAAPLPPASQEIILPLQADFDENSVFERLEIIRGQAQILTGDLILWQSPQGWNVRQVALSDLNQDGSIEAVLLVWRPFKSWPVDKWLPNGGRIKEFHNARGESCHIILIGWHRNHFAERWAGSALAQPVTKLALEDLNDDGFDELITLDSSYEAASSSPAHALKIWEWNGFGFSLVSELKGVFNDLKVVLAPDLTPILMTP
jgi:hypothetical protein